MRQSLLVCSAKPSPFPGMAQVIHSKGLMALVKICHSRVAFLIQCFRDKKSNLKDSSECITVYFKAGD